MTFEALPEGFRGLGQCQNKGNKLNFLEKLVPTSVSHCHPFKIQYKVKILKILKILLSIFNQIFAILEQSSLLMINF